MSSVSSLQDVKKNRVCHLKRKKEFLKRIDKRSQGLFLFNFLKVLNSSYDMVLQNISMLFFILRSSP